MVAQDNSSSSVTGPKKANVWTPLPEDDEEGRISHTYAHKLKSLDKTTPPKEQTLSEPNYRTFPTHREESFYKGYPAGLHDCYTPVTAMCDLPSLLFSKCL